MPTNSGRLPPRRRASGGTASVAGPIWRWWQARRMRLAALMGVRNEDWVLPLSARVALRWSDVLVVLDHASSDGTPAVLAEVAAEHPGRVRLLRSESAEWNEADHRQRLLDEARRARATHMAIVDGDEVVSGAFVPYVRPAVASLRPGELLRMPLVPLWGSLDRMRADGSWITDRAARFAWRDETGRRYRAGADGFQLHRRVPGGPWTDVDCPERLAAIGAVADERVADAAGGILHLDGADQRRLWAKLALFKMTEQARWPGRRLASQINAQYDRRLGGDTTRTRPVPAAWLSGLDQSAVTLGGVSWHEAECRRLWAEFGPARFEGLELWGYPQGDPRPPA